MSHWNHRVMAHEYVRSDGEREIYLEIHEVHYHDDGTPRAYGEEPRTVGGETIEGIKWVLDKMMNECLSKPILWHGEKFPEEYKEVTTEVTS